MQIIGSKVAVSTLCSGLQLVRVLFPRIYFSHGVKAIISYFNSPTMLFKSEIALDNIIFLTYSNHVSGSMVS